MCIYSTPKIFSFFLMEHHGGGEGITNAFFARNVISMCAHNEFLRDKRNACGKFSLGTPWTTRARARTHTRVSWWRWWCGECPKLSLRSASKRVVAVGSGPSNQSTNQPSELLMWFRRDICGGMQPIFFVCALLRFRIFYYETLS